MNCAWQRAVEIAQGPEPNLPLRCGVKHFHPCQRTKRYASFLIRFQFDSFLPSKVVMLEPEHDRPIDKWFAIFAEQFVNVTVTELR